VFFHPQRSCLRQIRSFAVDDHGVGLDDAKDVGGVVVDVADLGDAAILGRGLDRGVTDVDPAEVASGGGLAGLGADNGGVVLVVHVGVVALDVGVAGAAEAFNVAGGAAAGEGDDGEDGDDLSESGHANLSGIAG
jgi:hypothetical protein